MKRKISYVVIVFLLAAQSVLSATEATQDQLDSWSGFNNAHDNQWRITWDTLGMPDEIVGGTVVPSGPSPEEIARNFLAELAGVFTIEDLKNQLEVEAVDTSRLDVNFVVHVRFREIFNDFPVLDCLIKAHISMDNTIHFANSIVCRLDNSVDHVQLVLDRDDAITLGTGAIPAGEILTEDIVTDSGFVRMENANVLAWRVIIPTRDPWHEWQVTMEQDGTIIEIIDILRHETGFANVYHDHPFTGDPEEVTLSRLDGTHYLCGDYADARNVSHGQAYEEDNDFRYNPGDSHFDDANAYYHVDMAQHLALQRGFTFHRPITIYVDLFDCNAFYSTTYEYIAVGNGGAECNNFAWEAAIIYHEYGHHISHKLVGSHGFNYPWQSGAISEGVSDYLGCSWTDDPDINEYAAAAHPSMQRHLENDYFYPDNYDPGDPHFSSQLLSGTLWELRQSITPTYGQPVMDQLVIAAIGYSKPNEKFAGFWKRIVDADAELRYS